jgi:hypothetical protein
MRVAGLLQEVPPSVDRVTRMALRPGKPALMVTARAET